MKCSRCNIRNNKVEVITTEIGQVRWINPKIKKDGTIINLGSKWKYEGGETNEEDGYLIICKKCGGIIKKIKCNY